MRWIFASLLACGLLASGSAGAQQPFERIVVFGDSLSDPGNAFIILGGMNLKARDYGMTTAEDLLFLIPDAPYAIGGNHFSNGPTWIEQLARPIGLAQSVRPAFSGVGSQATNYAVGGARAHEDGGNFNLWEQVRTFLDEFRVAPSDALYVMAIGGNDVRDALILGPSIIPAALGSIADNVGALYRAGARKFLIWNSPDLGLTPAIRRLDQVSPGAAAGATALSFGFNQGLAGVIAQLSALPGIQIVQFDAFGALHEVVAHPASFGLTDVTNACITPNVPPFRCQPADANLFWDGIHPTKAGHGIIAAEVARALMLEALQAH